MHPTECTMREDSYSKLWSILATPTVNYASPNIYFLATNSGTKLNLITSMTMSTSLGVLGSALKHSLENDMENIAPLIQPWERSRENNNNTESKIMPRSTQHPNIMLV